MNIKLLITAVVAAISISIYAQNPPPGGPPGGQRGPGQGRGRGGMMNNPDLQKELNLSAGQQTKIKAIQDKYRTKMRAIFGRPASGQGKGPQPGKGTGRPPMDPAKMKQFQSLREAQMKEVNGVLNTKQQAILKKWIAAHPPRRPGGPGGRPGGTGRGNAL